MEGVLCRGTRYKGTGWGATNSLSLVGCPHARPAQAASLILGAGGADLRCCFLRIVAFRMSEKLI